MPFIWQAADFTMKRPTDLNQGSPKFRRSDASRKRVPLDQEFRCRLLTWLVLRTPVSTLPKEVGGVEIKFANPARDIRVSAARLLQAEKSENFGD